MKHLRVVFDNGRGEDGEVKHYLTTADNAAAVVAEMKAGRAMAIENYNEDRLVRVCTTYVRADQINLIEVTDR
jgi:hypothetical protein